MNSIFDILPAPGESIDKKEILSLLPELSAMKDTPQDLRWHPEGTVWNHTMMALESLVGMKEYAGASLQVKQILFLAALLHDIGKISSTQNLPDGQIVSYGHAKKGAIYSRQLLWQHDVPFEVRETICALIENHMLPVHAFEDRLGRRPEFLAHRLSWELPVQLLCILAEADTRGRGGEQRRDVLDTIELFREVAREEKCFDAPKSFPDAHTRLQYVRTNGAIHLETPFYQTYGSNVFLLSGLPAAGKNTWCEKYPQLPVVSFDDARRELGLSHGDNDGKATQHVHDRVRQFLRHREPFAWNATNLSLQMRGKSLDLLYSYNASVEIVYLECPAEILRQRNRQRENSLPDSAIDRLLRHWEIPKAYEAHEVTFQIGDWDENKKALKSR